MGLRPAPSDSRQEGFVRTKAGIDLTFFRRNFRVAKDRTNTRSIMYKRRLSPFERWNKRGASRWPMASTFTRFRIRSQYDVQLHLNELPPPIGVGPHAE
jgi:hypothetical protein